MSAQDGGLFYGLTFEGVLQIQADGTPILFRTVLHAERGRSMTKCEIVPVEVRVLQPARHPSAAKKE